MTLQAKERAEKVQVEFDRKKENFEGWQVFVRTNRKLVHQATCHRIQKTLQRHFRSWLNIYLQRRNRRRIDAFAHMQKSLASQIRRRGFDKLRQHALEVQSARQVKTETNRVLTDMNRILSELRKTRSLGNYELEI